MCLCFVRIGRCIFLVQGRFLFGVVGRALRVCAVLGFVELVVVVLLVVVLDFVQLGFVSVGRCLLLVRVCQLGLLWLILLYNCLLL